MHISLCGLLAESISQEAGFQWLAGLVTHDQRSNLCGADLCIGSA